MGPSSQGGTFFREIWWPVRWVPAVRWRNNYFACNKEAFPCVRPWTQLSASPRIVHVRWKYFHDHVDHAAPRAPGQWTMVRPRKGMTRGRGRRGSGCPRVEEYEGSLVRCGVRLPSPQNNRGCWCQNRQISGRGSRTVHQGRMVTGGKGHEVLPRFGPS